MPHFPCTKGRKELHGIHRLHGGHVKIDERCSRTRSGDGSTNRRDRRATCRPGQLHLHQVDPRSSRSRGKQAGRPESERDGGSPSPPDHDQALQSHLSQAQGDRAGYQYVEKRDRTRTADVGPLGYRRRHPGQASDPSYVQSPKGWRLGSSSC